VVLRSARYQLATLPTPVQRAERLERRLGCGPILVKRDDLTGFAAAGNKARPLEYLVGAALARGCDVLVTGGGPGSNFCSATAIAAAVAGLDCELVIAGVALPEPLPPNVALARAAGATVHLSGDDDREAVDAAVERLGAGLRTAGRRPFVLPRGGSTATGAFGFAVAAAELADQLAGWSGVLDGRRLTVVLPVGSGASCAGLLAGMASLGQHPWHLLGVSVSRPLAEIDARVRCLAADCAAEAGLPPPVAHDLELVDGRGAGFAAPSEANLDDARSALRSEGWLLDPTYTMKAFSVLVRRVHEDPETPVLFWHTGGVVAAVLGARPSLPSTTGTA